MRVPSRDKVTPMSTNSSDESRQPSSSISESVKTLLDQRLLLAGLFGIGLIAFGAIQGDGAVAGMLGIYGVTLILVSAGIYAVLAVARRNH